MEIISLITDRTENDVDFAKAEMQAVQKGSKPSETYMKGLKGCYTTTDINRVENTVQRIADVFAAIGYKVSVLTKRNWSTNDIFNDIHLQRYLTNIQSLRNLIPVLSTTPEVPNHYAPWYKANDIEHILHDLNVLRNNIEYAWFYSNELYCGEV